MASLRFYAPGRCWRTTQLPSLLPGGWFSTSSRLTSRQSPRTLLSTEVCSPALALCVRHVRPRTWETLGRAATWPRAEAEQNRCRDVQTAPSKLAGLAGPELRTSSVVRICGRRDAQVETPGALSGPTSFPESCPGWAPSTVAVQDSGNRGGQQGASLTWPTAALYPQSQPGLTLDLSQSRRCPARKV